jgi:predicted MPP superfamily phosphohydrolase
MPASLKKSLLALGGLALAGGLIYAHFIEPRWLHVRYMRLRLPRLPREFHGYMIAQIADIHMGSWMTRARLQSVVDVLNDIQPDVVAITGDLVDRKALFSLDDLTIPLAGLQPLDAVVAVLGNHDYRFNARIVRRVLADCDIIELDNRVHTLRRGAAALHIAGVDTVTLRRDCLDAVLDALPPDGAAVLLAHEPDFADVSAPTERFDLQISGHTHGGQVRLPLLGVPIRPDHGKRYPAGLYRVGAMYLYTNRGVGMVPPHMRLGARPEITVYILESC